MLRAKCSMSWNTQKYRESIINKYGTAVMTNLEKHLYALNWKNEKLLLHKEAIEQCWNDVFNRPKVSSHDQAFKYAYYFSMAEGEAIIVSLHSQADVLAHLINVILGNNKLTGKFYFRTVKNKLEQFNIAVDVKNRMQDLLNAFEFKYVTAFCNIIKHISLIDVSWSPGNLLEPGSYEKMKSAMKFNSFVYKNPFTNIDESYPAIHIRDIYGSYQLAIRNRVCAIGNSLNDFLSQA